EDQEFAQIMGNHPLRTSERSHPAPIQTNDKKGSMTFSAIKNWQSKEENPRGNFMPPRGAPQERPNKCIFCNQEGHKSFLCHLTPQERVDSTLNSERCTLCLRTGHYARNCQAEKCRKCSGR